MDYIDAWEDAYRAGKVSWHGKPYPLPELEPGSRVLEVGCGNGKTLDAMVCKGWSVVAIDISPTAVEVCRKRMPGVEFHVADVRALPFTGASFDAAFAFHVIGHLAGGEREKAVRELSRVVRPGGCVFFRSFSVEDMRCGRGREVEPGTFQRGTGIVTHYFHRQELVRLLEPHAIPGSVVVEEEHWRMGGRSRSLERAELVGWYEVAERK